MVRFVGAERSAFRPKGSARQEDSFVSHDSTVFVGSSSFAKAVRSRERKPLFIFVLFGCSSWDEMSKVPLLAQVK